MLLYLKSGSGKSIKYLKVQKSKLVKFNSTTMTLFKVNISMNILSTYSIHHSQNFFQILQATSNFTFKSSTIIFTSNFNPLPEHGKT